jgi:hypothetical protein
MYVFVMDLGRSVKIHRGSRYERLLWRVTDLRSFSRERMDIIYGARGHAHPDRDTAHHIFFTCPENAAKAYGWARHSDEQIYEFYKQRDNILRDALPSDELSIPWWETTKFCLDGVKSLKHHGVEPWELRNPIRFDRKQRTCTIRRTNVDNSDFLGD